MAPNGNFLKIPKNVSWGQNAQNGRILIKLLFGSHFWVTMSNIIAKLSTDTNFKYKEWLQMEISLKSQKMFPGDKMPKMAIF